MPRAKELKIRIENHPGVLGEVAAALAKKKLNLRAAHAWLEGSAGCVRLVAEKPAVARKALVAGGWPAEEHEVLEVTLADKPGALAELTAKLGRAGVNIEHLYVGSAGAARQVKAFVGVSDLAAALKAAR